MLAKNMSLLCFAIMPLFIQMGVAARRCEAVVTSKQSMQLDYCAGFRNLFVQTPKLSLENQLSFSL